MAKGGDGRDEREKALERTLELIEKQFGKGAIMKLSEGETRLDVATIPTGSPALDLALGVGGVPRGRVIEVFGPEASGLDNAVMARADLQMRFETNPDFSSLNLAQCVLLFGWEWKCARAAAGGARPSPGEMSDISIPTAPEDVLSGLGSFVSKAAKKKLAGGSAPKDDAPFFSSTTEIRSISTNALPAATFEVPAGFRKLQ